MSQQSAAVWLVIAAAAVAANLPFISQRWLLVVARPHKPLGLRLLEMLLLYLATGTLGLLLESRMGQTTPQGWAFYAVTAALFATLGFPGFVYRYLLRRARGAV